MSEGEDRRRADPATSARRWLQVFEAEGLEFLPSPRTPGGVSLGQPAAGRPEHPPAEPRRRATTVRTLVPPLGERLGPAEKIAALDEVAAEIARCDRCPLHRGRTHTVPGEGHADADLMFVGEGPGRDEDLSGRPFVGRAGELLTRIIEAIGFTRETVFIANVVKCRPPNNRTPTPQETGACFPFLERQIEIVDPLVICTLGTPATRQLLGVSDGIGRLRGRAIPWRGRVVVPTFHPAYLLRNPAAKPAVWEDVQKVVAVLKERGGRIPRPEVLERNLARKGSRR